MSSIQKHSLVRAPLRASRAASTSGDSTGFDANVPPGDGHMESNPNETYQVAYCVEHDMQIGVLGRCHNVDLWAD